MLIKTGTPEKIIDIIDEEDLKLNNKKVKEAFVQATKDASKKEDSGK